MALPVSETLLCPGSPEGAGLPDVPARAAQLQVVWSSGEEGGRLVKADHAPSEAPGSSRRRRVNFSGCGVFRSTIREVKPRRLRGPVVGETFDIPFEETACPRIAQRLALAVFMVALAACAGRGDSPPASQAQSPTTAPGPSQLPVPTSPPVPRSQATLQVPPGREAPASIRPEPTSEPPTRWATTSLVGDQILVEIWEEGRSLGVYYTKKMSSPDGIYTLGVSDMAFHDDWIAIATCCEPAVGSIDFVDTVTGAVFARAQGSSIDAFDGWAATRDTAGLSTFSVQTGHAIDPKYLGIDGFVTDFAIGDNSNEYVVQFEAAVTREQSLLVLSRGATVQVAIGNDPFVCGLVGLRHSVGILVDNRTGPDCSASTQLWVLDWAALTAGRLEPVRTIDLPDEALEANSDASGTYVAYITPDGDLRWVDLDGRSGSIGAKPSGGSAYVALDW